MENYLYEVITDKALDIKAQSLRVVFHILSFFYCALVRLQDFVYKKKILRPAHLEVKVISVGNITWGGTGKTSLVSILAKFLSGKGKRIAILSRGYKRVQSTEYREQKTREEYQLMGDEACLLKEKFPEIPVLVGRDRVENAIKAVKDFQAEVVLLDDGFQHRRIKRDLDIVSIDCLNPFGNGYCIPRGILREPKSSLERADLVVLTNAEFNKEEAKELEFDIRDINSKAPIVYASYRALCVRDFPSGQVIIPSHMVGKPVCLFAGIGNFESFRNTFVSSIGGNVKLEFNFPDHYQYQKQDLLEIQDACIKQGVNLIITTEKDLVRLKQFIDNSLLVKIAVLEVELEILKNKDKFFERVENVCLG
ncbi:MAG: tetraacyldisaccharide 4'-kinase [Candidatus Omnitrophota bacterium]